MLQHVIAILILAILAVIALFFVKIVLPLWHFMTRADDVITLYQIFKKIWKEDDSSKETKCSLLCGNYKIEYSNVEEASIAYETIAKDALTYYEKLGWIATIGDSGLRGQKDELINICNEVRMLRWNN